MSGDAAGANACSNERLRDEGARAREVRDVGDDNMRAECANAIEFCDGHA